MGIDEARRHRETSFGPPSQIIRSNEFVGEASASVEAITREVAALWKKTKKQTRDHVLAELNPDDLRAQTAQLTNNETLYNFLNQRYVEHSTKRKEHDEGIPLPPAGSEEARLALLLDQNPLTHWPPPKQSLYYFRKNKKTDENVLAGPTLTENGPPLNHNTAILTVSYYSRLTKTSNRNDVWVQGYSLDATYAFLSTQSLQDIYDTFPCASRSIPEETWVNGQFNGYENGPNTIEQLHGGIVMGKYAYGDGKGPWARQMVEMSKRSQTPDGIQEARILNNNVLGDLDLQLQMPYWVMHQGNCTHCWVIDSIRLGNNSDPSTGYPVGLFMSKQPHPTCHHCGRNPVTLAVNGDSRLGESPSRICETCWKIMGPPKVNPQDGGGRVVVVSCIL